MEATRVIPVAALTGEAAGIAAAMADDENIYASDLNIGELQNVLRRQNIKIHKTEL